MQNLNPAEGSASVLSGWNSRLLKRLSIVVQTRAFFWVVALAGLAALIALALSIFGVERSQVIKPQDMISRDGLMTAAPVISPWRLWRSHGDTNETRSTTRLFENGRPLGPAHTLHAVIIEKGGGAYSHFHRHIYFSSSDNTDPRLNGRAYRIDYRIFLSPGLALSGGVIFLLMLGGVAATGGFPSRETFRREFARFVAPASFTTLTRVAAGGLLVAILIVLLTHQDTLASVLKVLRSASKSLVTLTFCILAGVYLSNVISRDWYARLLSPLQAFGFLLLAAGIKLNVPGRLYLAAAFAAFIVALCVRCFQIGRRSYDGVIARMRAEDTVVRWIIVGCMLLAIVQAVPEVVIYWNQSGWMDSASYDQLANRIATGTLPFGWSYYMPVYQFGMAAFYWAFGHAPSVQQVINTLLVTLTVGFSATAVWILFRDKVLVLVMGLITATWSQLHHAVWMPQIENWYIPSFAGSLLAVAYYLVRRNVASIAIVALTAALIFNIRLQGAFYAAALGLVPLFVPQAFAGWRATIKHLAVFFVIFFCIGIMPWSMRNLLMDGRFSPSSVQSTQQLAVLNDPRIPLYGIRYWEGWVDIVQEWHKKYPEEAARLEAQSQYLRDRLRNNPEYFVNAAPYRLMAFYGLLPSGWLAMDRLRNPNWREEWWSYTIGSLPFSVPIVLSLLAWMARPKNKVNLLFAGLIGANAIVALSAGFAEPRLCYPVLALHFLMGMGLYAPLVVARDPHPVVLPINWGRILSCIFVVMLVGLPFFHLVVGQHHKYAAMLASGWRLSPKIEIESSIPTTDFVKPIAVANGKEVPLKVGDAYRTELKLTSNMYPTKYVCCFSDFNKTLQPPESVQYYYGYIPNKSVIIAVRFDGALVQAPLLENSTIDAVVRIDAIEEEPQLARYWVAVERAIVVRGP